MPLTAFQGAVLTLLAPQRSDASYLAGGAALHIGPAGERFINDLNFFQALRGIVWVISTSFDRAAVGGGYR